MRKYLIILSICLSIGACKKKSNPVPEEPIYPEKANGIPASKFSLALADELSIIGTTGGFSLRTRSTMDGL